MLFVRSRHNTMNLNTVESTAPPVVVKPKVAPAVKLFCDIVSWVFHPVFMPLITALVLYAITKSQFLGFETRLLYHLLGATFLNTIFFPLFATFMMYKLGFISGIKMPTMRDRVMPLLASMIFYFWIYQVFKNFGAHENITDQALYIFKVFFFGNFFALIGVFLINIFTKISMHTAAAGGALGIMIVLALIGNVNILLILLAAVLVAGAVGTARLLLHEHTPLQIWLGYLVGIVSMLVAYWLYL